MEFNLEPYWDDFAATNGALENNYMRILFRPGYAVQARELTQIQSILQNQIKQFGDHIFKDGSPVIGGHLTIDTGIRYLKLQPQDASGQDIDLENFLGVTVYNTIVPRTRAKVIQTFDTSTDRTLMVRYLRGPGFSAGQTIQTAAGFTANVATGTFSGTGSTVSINDGVFYVDGFFVTVLPQTIILDPYSSTPTFRVGLEIDENIVTDSMDNALLDPAQESFNYQAPGAHRYQFTLNLAKRSIDSVDDRRFFELLRVENGVITKQVSYPIYSELEKTLARRTYDESGNYEVRPFVVTATANTPPGITENTATFLVNVQPGKAYVKGFEYETIGTTKLHSTRARNFSSEVDKNLSIYYGNRIFLANVMGSSAGIGFSDTTLTEVDIHCVSNNNVVLNGNTANYYSTRIGTAKIKNFDRVDGTDANTYYMYLTDIDVLPITSTANSTTNTTAIQFGPHFSPTNNAYQNCTVTIVNNAGSSGNVARITSYVGATRTAFISPPIRTAMLRGATFALTVPAEFAKSIVIANTSSFTAANLQANVAEGSRSKDAQGNTIFTDAKLDTMIYKIPNYYVKYDSDKNVDFYRRVKTTENFTTNGAITITLAPGQRFDFGTDGSLLSEQDRIEYLIVVPRTGANAGKILDMTQGTRNVYKTDSQTLTLYTANGSGDVFTGDIYVTTKLTNANGSYRRVKTLVRSNNEIAAGDTLGSASPVVGYNEVFINSTNGTVWFTSANVVNKTPGEKSSLFLSDVIKINKIYDSGNLSHAPNTTNKIDITDRYVFDAGHTDNYYDHATITLKPGSAPPSGQTVVFVDYYTHTGTGYISQRSYANSIYENEQIPIYKSQSGQLYNLRDCIDLRPLRSSGLVANPYKTITLGPTVNVSANQLVVTANTARIQNVFSPPIVSGSLIKINGEYRTVDSIDNPTQIRVTKAFTAACTNGAIELVTENIQLSGGLIQEPNEDMLLDYDYYLPRIDKVVATKDKEFKVITGVPSLVPIPPPEPEDSMAICTMELPPYTASLKSINIKHIENRRYTMKDISLIDKRLAHIEDYVRLKESEKQILSNPPRSPETPNINKPIYGTIVDEFDDMSVVDNSPSAEFSASIEKGVLTCAKLIKSYSLEPTKWSTGDKLFMLNYTESPFAQQTLYSNTAPETVQTAIIAKFEGFATLSPERDYFYSQVFLPTVSDTPGRSVEPPTVLDPPTLPIELDPWRERLYCPAPWMYINLADGKQIQAGDLKVGMKVHTYHEESMEEGDYEVTHVEVINNAPRIEIEFDNTNFVCSHSHKFYKDGEWVVAAELAVGDVVGLAPNTHEVLGIYEYDDGEIVKITVDGAHTYVCEGILSHNKLPDLPRLDPEEPKNIIEDIGGNEYADPIYNQPVVVGPELPTIPSIFIDIPHWSIQPQIDIEPRYIDYFQTLNVAPIVASNSYVSVDIATTPDTITTSNPAVFNLASIGLTVGSFLAIGNNLAAEEDRQERFIKYIDPAGSFVQVDTNFETSITSANLANVSIVETFTPTVESQQIILEPYITQQIVLDFTSIMPETYLNEIWAPPLVEALPPPPDVDVPIFGPAWLQETIIAPTTDYGFDQFYNTSQDTGTPIQESSYNFNVNEFDYYNFENFYYDFRF